MRINKHLFLTTLFCPSYGWLSQRQNDEKKRNEADQFRIDQGVEIGELARSLFPDGILIKEDTIEAAVEKTQALMENPDVNCLFEAAFLSKGFATRADILIRERESWNLIEVKSSVKDKAGYIADLAYTYMVIEMCGYRTEGCQLCLLSRDYHPGLKKEEMFQFLDHSRQVKLRTEEFRKKTSSILALLRSKEKPEEPFKSICKNCEYFKSCFDFDILEHIISLPFISIKLYNTLLDQGISKIVDLPETLKLTAHQILMKKSLVEKKTVIAPELPAFLNKVQWPAFYLDFETTMTAIPLFPETYPYQQIVTQYSLHICRTPGEITEHREFLAETDRDCRKDLAENLIRDLEGEGSIIVYSGFEKSTIKKLASILPDLQKDLMNLIPRLVDLEIIIKNGIYHPDFQGRSSIKKTLPALVPEMDYEDLAIGNGSAALTAFARMVRGDVPSDKIPQLRKDLLVYCKQDTLAMVKLHEALIMKIDEQKTEENT